MPPPQLDPQPQDQTVPALQCAIAGVMGTEFVSRIPVPRVRAGTPGGRAPGLTLLPAYSSSASSAAANGTAEETPQRAPAVTRRSSGGSLGNTTASQVGRHASGGVGYSGEGAVNAGGGSGSTSKTGRLGSGSGNAGIRGSHASGTTDGKSNVIHGDSASSHAHGAGSSSGGGSMSGVADAGISNSGGGAESLMPPYATQGTIPPDAVPGGLGPYTTQPALASSLAPALAQSTAAPPTLSSSLSSFVPQYLGASYGTQNALSSFSPMTTAMKDTLQARLLSLPDQVASLSAALQKSNENLRTCHTSLKEVILKDEQMRARFQKAVQEGGLLRGSPFVQPGAAGVAATPSPGPDSSWAYATPASLPRRYVPSSHDAQPSPFPALSPAAFDAVALPAPRPPSKQLQAKLAQCHQQTAQLSDELHTLRGDAEALRGSLAGMFDDALQRVRQQVGAAAAALERESLAQATQRAELAAKESAEADASARIRERDERLQAQDARVRELERQLAAATRARDDAVAREEAAMAKFRAEMKERRRVFNQLQELRGNVRVFCRVRPLTDDELAAQQAFEASFPEEGQLVLRNAASIHSAGKDRFNLFEFDNVFGPETSQADVFTEFEPMLTSVLDGYHVCIFAFGQTGSGKTYTMDGPPHDWGVNLRTLAALFERMEQRQGDYEYALSMSIVEIYNEQVRDLLAAKGSEEKLEVRQGPEGNHVPGAVVLPIGSLEEAIDMFERGRAHRATFSTNMNEHSSRSHCLVLVNVRGQNLVSGAGLSGRLVLVDLAGSERVSKSEATGDRLKEAQHINKSLSALGDVIQALALKSKHVPYRNSTLTYLLQDSLGGDGKTIMVAQISPATSNMQESLCSLNFAQRARGVETGPARKHLEQRSASADLSGLSGLDGPLDSGSEPSSPRSAWASHIPSPSPRSTSALGVAAVGMGGRGGPASTALGRSNSVLQTPTLRRPAVVTPGGAKKR